MEFLKNLAPTEVLFSPDAEPSSATSLPQKAAAKKRKPKGKKTAKRAKIKSSARSARKGGAKRKPAKKPAKRPQHGAKQGRPAVNFVDTTIVRMPKGWLALIHRKASAKGMKQGEFVRSAIARALGK